MRFNLTENVIGANLGLYLGESTKLSYTGGEVVNGYKINPGENLNIPEAFSTVINEIGDKNPLYITLAVPSGYSRKLDAVNNPVYDIKSRFWPETVIDSLIKKVKDFGEQGSGLPGYPGHAKDSEDLKSLPNPVVLWINGANAHNVKTGEHAGILRGYVYDVGAYRDYIKTGAFKNASVFGAAKVVIKEQNDQYVEFVEEANFISVDFVRTETHGIRGTEVIRKEGAEIDMDLTAEMRLLISKLTSEQIVEMNPKAAAELSKETSELLAENATLIDKLQNSVTQAAEAAVIKAEISEIAKVLGCEPGNVMSSLTEIVKLRDDAIKVAYEQSLNDITSEPLKKYVANQMGKITCETVTQLNDTFKSTVAEGKKFLVEMGVNLGSISSDVTHDKKVNSLASDSCKSKYLKITE